LNVLTIFIERLFLTFASRGLMSMTSLLDHAVSLSRVRTESVLLVIPPDQILERVQISLTHRGAAWAGYIEACGGAAEASGRFKRQQDEMLRLNEKLSPYMRTRTIEVADMQTLQDASVIEGLL
jgi:hypothetical protein